MEPDGQKVQETAKPRRVSSWRWPRRNLGFAPSAHPSARNRVAAPALADCRPNPSGAYNDPIGAAPE
jgi:hypothetical protein